MPRSVPASLLVKPVTKWYMAWFLSSLADGGQHAEGISGQEDDGLGHAGALAGELALLAMYSTG